VPAGFLHGYATLEPDTEVIYKVTGYYAPECDRGVQWDDPALGIAWPVAAEGAILSAKDQANRPLAEHPVYFHYQA
jgi:dTDP-4-dehydrorhamnose 3,5-epimerase